MKFFENDGKYNWVDENNIYLGYDSNQSCCEYAGYFYSNEHKERIEDPDLESYSFLVGYLEDVDCGDGGEGYDDGTGIEVALVSKSQPTLYLTIFNHHNGYYGHEWLLQKDGKTIKEGCL